MSTSKTYLKYEKSQNSTLTIKDQTQNVKSFSKIATLQPYLVEIEKRQKLKKNLNKNNKSKLNQSSSRSFRIKQLSTSLSKFTLQNRKQTINTTATLIPHHKLKIAPNDLNRPKKSKSHERTFKSSFSKTITNQKRKSHIGSQDNKQANIPNKQEKINFFNDYFLRIRTKDKGSTTGQPKFRKNLYEPTMQRKNSKSHAGEVSITKISYTDVSINRNPIQSKKKQHDQLQNYKKTENLRKNNFRRGKYENLHSSVNERPENKINQEAIQPLHSERLNKKQSNLSLNEQMDIIAEKQMQKFYRQVRTKQIQKSLQKSTQKYFGNDSYRPVKSKNQIQLYVSSVHNPSLNKISQSTNHNSDHRTKSPLDLKNPTDFYAYNFDFQQQKHNQNYAPNNNKIYQMQNASEEQSSFNNFTQEDFEKQRRNAEIQFFNKGHNKLEWSDDNCQIDDI